MSLPPLFRLGREVAGFCHISLDAGPDRGQPCVAREGPPCSGATGGLMNGAAFGIMIGVFAILSLLIIQWVLNNPNS
jgi:hypothetical protein